MFYRTEDGQGWMHVNFGRKAGPLACLAPRLEGDAPKHGEKCLRIGGKLCDAPVGKDLAGKDADLRYADLPATRDARRGPRPRLLSAPRPSGAVGAAVGDVMASTRKNIRLCVRCRAKYVQHRCGLCRACSRLTGAMTATTREIEADRLARQHARVPIVEPATPRAPRFVTVRGVDYEVVWP